MYHTDILDCTGIGLYFLLNRHHFASQSRFPVTLHTRWPHQSWERLLASLFHREPVTTLNSSLAYPATLLPEPFVPGGGSMLVTVLYSFAGAEDVDLEVDGISKDIYELLVTRVSLVCVENLLSWGY